MERKCIALLTQQMPNIADYKSSLPTRVEDTCHWILSNPRYHDWSMQNEACLLWISGYPGSGKTILSAYLLEYLGTSNLPAALYYFFCDEKIDKQRDAMAILRSLIHQLITRRRLLIKYIRASYDIQGPQFDQNFNELWRIFHRYCQR